MCVIQHSIEEATSVCPMCTVFRPSASRCPHVRALCRNRQAHPQCDVVYLKNAEVQTFNGCGYCKYANSQQHKNPTQPNAGWAGCCRAPRSVDENLLIPIADWFAVSAVHKVAPPPELAAVLEAFKTGAAGAVMPQQQVQPPRQASPKGTSTALGTPPKGTVSLAKPANPQVAIPKTAAGRAPPSGASGSPKQLVSPLRTEARGGVPVGATSPVLAPPDLRRSMSDKREPAPSSGGAAKAAVVRTKLGDPEATIGRRASNASSKSSVTSAAGLLGPLQGLALDDQGRPSKRRSSNAVDPAGSSPPNRRFVDVKNTPTPTRSARRSSSAENLKSPRAAASPKMASAASPKLAAASPKLASASPRLSTTSGHKPSKSMPISSKSSDGTSSTMSESTITSEGFTDYLSDDSELEIQREAERRALQTIQNHEEDQEFKMARKQLQRVDLRPPTTWKDVSTMGSRTGKGGIYPVAANGRQQLSLMEFARAK